eukprot:TRINITY_DN54077_c0_g1_i1.p1 TRINITY_DN54077_c0_g1~~TRINITY_DN54077_c0_g1_i1.p1  ORF type:complete len:212 (-),score=1.82 TRINITY_DN54077_c0_g1_i1:50-685(-)
MLQTSRRGPPETHRSVGYSVPKPNGVMRLTHGLCPYWSCWFRAAWRRGDGWQPKDYMHGFIPQRRREDAVFVTRIVAWRSKRCGRSFADIGFDMTNDVASPHLTRILEATREVALPADFSSFDNRVYNSTVFIDAEDGRFEVTVGQGIQQGCKVAPLQLGRVFQEPVTRWHQRLGHEVDGHRLLRGRGRFLDVSSRWWLRFLRTTHIVALW